LALPAHIKRGLEKHSKKAKAKKTRQWFNRVKELFRKLSLRLLRLRYPLVVLFIVVLVGSLWYAQNFMEFILFPTKNAEYLAADIELPSGTSLEVAEEQVTVIEGVISRLPTRELETFVSRIGTSERGGLGENRAQILVGLTPYSERVRTAAQIVEELRVKTEGLVKDGRVVFEVYGGGPPTGKPIDLRIIGTDDLQRKKLADSVESFLKNLDGVKDIDRDDKLGKDQIEIEIDRTRLARLGLTVADVAQNVRIAFDGEVVTTIRDGDEDVDFRVRLADVARRNIYFLENLKIPNRQGRLIRLGDVASLKTGPGPSAYRHVDGERAITIVGDVDRDLTTPLKVTNAVFEHFNLDKDWPGMKMIVGGEAEESEQAVVNLLGTFIIAAIGIYFLLVLLFDSLTQPFFVMVAIPFGIVGVIIAFALHNEPLGFFGMIGTIGLAGVVVNDSLVLVDHINNLKKKRPEANILELVAEGTSDRLRAIILTSITTVIGLLPLAYGIGGTDVWMAPMALALGYGLVFATPLTLVLIPCLYVIRGDIARMFRRRK
jgi:multidrug efflux pump subunit AcrB